MSKKPTKIRRAMTIGETAMGIATDTEAVPIGEGFKANVNGLVVSGKPSFESWSEAGKILRVVERGAQFAIGDFLVYGEDRFGEKASQIIDASEGWSEKTCAQYRWVANRIAQADRRMDRLGIAHHMVVAPLTPAKQRVWLGKAANDGEEQPWTVARLRKAVNAGEDLPVTGHYVLVKTKSEAKQAELMKKLEEEGYEVKAIMKRTKKKEAAAA